ncbi:unnamed protein product [Amoebophrya sp. A25]|nr:unnamed protein product [Amoebophrya sp. A25]|eukprot:GSA25T00024149001.1
MLLHVIHALHAMRAVKPYKLLCYIITFYPVNFHRSQRIDLIKSKDPTPFKCLLLTTKTRGL